ncbi:hypothetical protein JXO59_14880, partial [candidate division KSB1 bacterium]|nr:hypothetical protein [candidate division KSB1 bacterium]
MQSLTVNRNHPNQLVFSLLITCVAIVVSAGAWYVWQLETKWAVFGFLAILFPFIVAMTRDVRRFLIWMMIFLIPLGIDYKLFYHISHSGQTGVSLGTTEIILFILLI